MSRWSGITKRRMVVAVATAAGLGVIVLLFAWLRPDTPPAGTGPVTIASPEAGVNAHLTWPAHGRPLAGDPRHGARLFAMHCAGCHGHDGRGTGPSADVLHPKPRDLTDSLALGARTDAELATLVREGGTALGLSRNMPPFGDLVDELSAWDLVAYVRTLHTPRGEWMAADDDARWRTVILDDTAAAELAQATGHPPSPAERRVGLLMLPDGTALVSRTATEGDRRAALTLQINADGTAGRHAVHPPTAEPRDATTWTAARAGATALGAAALRQRARDTAAAEALHRRFVAAPQSLPAGQRRFLQLCAACHGPTGRVTGPNLSEGAFRARNLADPERMAAVSDDRMRRLIREGGEPLGVSPSMPSFKLPEAELTELIAYVRTLVVSPAGHPK